MIELARSVYRKNARDYGNIRSHPCVLFACDLLAAWRPAVHGHLAGKARTLYWGQDAKPSLEHRHRMFLKYAKLWGGRPVEAPKIGDLALIGEARIRHVGVLVEPDLVAHVHEKTRGFALDPLKDLRIAAFYRM
jgi:hypothetical protein